MNSEKQRLKRKAKAKALRIQKVYLKAIGAISAALQSLREPMRRFWIDINETTYEQHKAFIEANMPKIHKSHGLQEFDINGHKIWALNQRNAERKFNKLNLN